MSEIIEKNKQFLVKSRFGSYNFNNRKTAEQLNKTLNEYEKAHDIIKETEMKLDKLEKEIIKAQMSLSILQEDINNVKRAIK